MELTIQAGAVLCEDVVENDIEWCDNNATVILRVNPDHGHLQCQHVLVQYY